MTETLSPSGHHEPVTGGLPRARLEQMKMELGATGDGKLGQRSIRLVCVRFREARCQREAQRSST
jgi:hypothetical protein